MKLDFLSIHFYPDSWAGDGADDATGSNSTNVTNSYNRYKNNLVWVSKNDPLPWIIGETGFQTDASGGTLWGTETAQATFASNSLNDARSAGASGYAWWQFQDVGYETYGLLKTGVYSDPSSTYDGTYCHCYPFLAGAERQAASVFQSYLSTYGQTVSPVTITPAPNYYNPYLHPANPVDNLGNPSTVSNTYNDQNGNHLIDALVSASTVIWIDLYANPVKTYTDGHYSFANTSGTFTLLPYDYDLVHMPNTNKIDDYRITGVGVDVDERGWGGTFNPSSNGMLTSTTIPLWKAPGFFDIDENVSGVTVASGTQNFEGFETLTATNVDVLPSATSEFKARQYIQVNAEFHAEQGSDVHIYIDQTFPDCGMFWGYKSLTNSTTSNNNDDSNEESEIDLQFKKKANQFGFMVQPNPNSGIFTILIDLPTNAEQNVEINVYDLMGKNVYSKSSSALVYNMDFSAIAKGIYYIQVKNNEKSINKKLIIQ
jgi:Secretion system C-terminal sorting domain